MVAGKFAVVVVLISLCQSVLAATLADTVKQIKPAVVGVGLVAPLATVSHQLKGTGFVIGNGRYVVTNTHVIDMQVPEDVKYQRTVFAGHGKKGQILPVQKIYRDEEHDLAILEIPTALPALPLYNENEAIPDGTDIAVTGFPIGGVLGLYPATHKGIVAAYTPNIIAAKNTSQISEQFLQRLRNPFMVYQLDVVAYPGNSGSPVYRADTKEVFAVVNKVFVKETKESAITRPSGITYAIPASHISALARKHNIPLQ